MIKKVETTLKLERDRSKGAGISSQGWMLRPVCSSFSAKNMIRAYISDFVLIAICSLVAVSCWRPPGFGIGGRYLDARFEISNPRGNLEDAITKLEYVVHRNPSYKNSLTLLGRAYYKSGRYQDASRVLKEALAVNPQDEIALITLGLTQFRSGDDQRGLETLKRGLTLLSKVSKDGYKDIEFWDKNRLVRRALRKTIVFVSKGLEEKHEIIRTGEILLTRIDNELWEGRREKHLDEREP